VCIPGNYLAGLVEWLEKSGADNVGGVWRILPGADTAMARAIALGLAHPFGVGNAYYRIGTSTTTRWVDTVPFGCYRREVFSRCGRFDEDQVRTEDDEFNLRLRKNGGRILLVPEISIDYYARERLSQVWRMYYQYGYFKPMVARKLGWDLLSLRHLVPSLFVLTLGASLLLSRWFPGWGSWVSWSWGFIWGRISPSRPWPPGARACRSSPAWPWCFPACISAMASGLSGAWWILCCGVKNQARRPRTCPFPDRRVCGLRFSVKKITSESRARQSLAFIWIFRREAGNRSKCQRRDALRFPALRSCCQRLGRAVHADNGGHGPPYEKLRSP
jgi:hypothetical protein